MHTRLGIDEQVAIYAVFHRDRVNRAIHTSTTPVIVVSGFMLLSPLGVPGARGLNLPLLGLVATLAAFASLEWIVTLAFAAVTVPSLLFANLVAERLSLPALVSLCMLAQGVAWFVTVHVGHERFEPHVLCADAPGEPPAQVSSNLYFRRGYFLLRNIGRTASAIERFQQFAIGPFAEVLELLLSLGYRPGLRASIDALSREYAGRVARGETILPGGDLWSSSPEDLGGFHEADSVA